MKDGATASEEKSVPHVLSQDGNCIPAAIAQLTGRTAEIASKLQQRTPANAEFAQRDTANRVRSYKECAALASVTLVPQADFPTGSGDYLLHVENGGRPHCAALRTRDDGSCELVDGSTSWEIPAGVVATATATGVDAPTLVVFRLVTEAARGVGKEEKVLLDAEAGAGGEEDVPVAALLASMKKEKKAFVKKLKEAKQVKKTRCTLCPKRSFDRASRALDHVNTYHVAKHNYCPGGSKTVQGRASPLRQ